MDQDRLLNGALLIVAAEFMFAFMGASIRLVSTDRNNGMVVFARNLVGLSLILSLVAPPRHRKLSMRVPHLHLLRSAAGLGAMYCFFYAIAHIPLADAMLLKLIAPLFMPLIWWWDTPTADQLLWLLVPGVFATSGQILLTRGMACAPAARLGPFAFFFVVFGAALGWIFWDEILGWLTVAGTLLVLISAMLFGRGMPHTTDVAVNAG